MVLRFGWGVWTHWLERMIMLLIVETACPSGEVLGFVARWLGSE